jgi:ABC-type dipeptide/oligopeptide/nickel transport system permease subunit
MRPVRLSSSAGIALGPILFILAILGLIATVMAAGGSSGFGTAGNADRVNADVSGQANLIRGKINECYMQYLLNGVNNSSSPCAGDAYPCSDQTSGTLVSALTCPGDPLVSSSQQSIWTGLRVAQLPPPTRGFNDWYYMNGGDEGGRCIWTTSSIGANTGLVAGLKLAARKFSSTELKYNSSSSSQKFVIFITPPTGTVTPLCTAD